MTEEKQEECEIHQFGKVVDKIMSFAEQREVEAGT